MTVGLGRWVCMSCGHIRHVDYHLLHCRECYSIGLKKVPDYIPDEQTKRWAIATTRKAKEIE